MMNYQSVLDLFIQLRKLENTVTNDFKSQTGVSLARFLVLQRIEANPKISPNEIQQTLDINKSAVTRHIQALVSKNLVICEPNPNDGREILVSLTAEGLATMQHCKSSHSTTAPDAIFTQISELKQQISVIEKEN